MNQILKPEINISEEASNNNDFQKKNKNINKNDSSTSKNIDFRNNKTSNSNGLYLFQFLISSFIAVCFLIFFFIRIFHLNEKEDISDGLLRTYQLSTLYSNDTDYTTKRIQSNSYDLYTSSSNTPFVIGMIKIDKINLNYPILSESSKELLNISVCRFAGPMPNTSGNLCIAGHNYVDYKFFSRLHELEKDDKIKLYDLNGQMKQYVVSQKYETKADDTSCTSQYTNGETILTLLTCNNVSGKRLVLVCKLL